MGLYMTISYKYSHRWMPDCFNINYSYLQEEFRDHMENNIHWMQNLLPNYRQLSSSGTYMQMWVLQETDEARMDYFRVLVVRWCALCQKWISLIKTCAVWAQNSGFWFNTCSSVVLGLSPLWNVSQQASITLNGLACFGKALCPQSIYPFTVIKNKSNKFIVKKAHMGERHLLDCNRGAQFVLRNDIFSFYTS